MTPLSPWVLTFCALHISQGEECQARPAAGEKVTLEWRRTTPHWRRRRQVRVALKSSASWVWRWRALLDECCNDKHCLAQNRRCKSIRNAAVQRMRWTAEYCIKGRALTARYCSRSITFPLHRNFSTRSSGWARPAAWRPGRGAAETDGRDDELYKTFNNFLIIPRFWAARSSVNEWGFQIKISHKKYHQQLLSSY